LQGAFLNALAEDFDEHGKKAIVACRELDPSAYLRAIVALMPKELEITRGLDDLSDEQLDAAAVAVRAILAAQGDRSGASETQGAEPAAGLPALPQAG